MVGYHRSPINSAGGLRGGGGGGGTVRPSVGPGWCPGGI